MTRGVARIFQRGECGGRGGEGWGGVGGKEEHLQGSLKMIADECPQGSLWIFEEL